MRKGASLGASDEERRREDMKKLAYIILTSILALTLVEVYSTAHADRPEFIPFEENLEGTISGGIMPPPHKWIKITQQIITGIGKGNLSDSPVTFTITAEIRYNEDIGKSFTSGNWTIVASAPQGSISGRFLGKGTEPTEFSGTFKNFNDSGTGIYYDKKIYGEFESQYLEPGPYGAPWRYEASWTGTIKVKG